MKFLNFALIACSALVIVACGNDNGNIGNPAKGDLSLEGSTEIYYSEYGGFGPATETLLPNVRLTTNTDGEVSALISTSQRINPNVGVDRVCRKSRLLSNQESDEISALIESQKIIAKDPNAVQPADIPTQTLRLTYGESDTSYALEGTSSLGESLSGREELKSAFRVLFSNIRDDKSINEDCVIIN